MHDSSATSVEPSASPSKSASTSTPAAIPQGWEQFLSDASLVLPEDFQPPEDPPVPAGE